MKVIEPGHVYGLFQLDFDKPNLQALMFVKRLGDKYPGNQPPAHHGVNLQEVWRACIDRLQYVDKQDPHPANKRAIFNLRACIFALEERAAERHGRKLSNRNLNGIELLPTCEKCGHVECPGNCHD